jgi:hypothetical protein
LPTDLRRRVPAITGRFRGLDLRRRLPASTRSTLCFSTCFITFFVERLRLRVTGKLATGFFLTDLFLPGPDILFFDLLFFALRLGIGLRLLLRFVMPPVFKLFVVILLNHLLLSVYPAL